MNLYLLLAGSLAFIVGLVHSVLGERMIFSHLRTRGWVPVQGGQLLREHQVRIVWASWHLVTIFGWCLAAVLVCLALPGGPGGPQMVIGGAIVVTMLLGAALVFAATRGRHLGWLGLLGVAVLTALGLALA